MGSHKAIKWLCENRARVSVRDCVKLDPALLALAAPRLQRTFRCQNETVQQKLDIKKNVLCHLVNKNITVCTTKTGKTMQIYSFTRSTSFHHSRKWHIHSSSACLLYRVFATRFSFLVYLSVWKWCKITAPQLVRLFLMKPHILWQNFSAISFVLIFPLTKHQRSF